MRSVIQFTQQQQQQQHTTAADQKKVVYQQQAEGDTVITAVFTFAGVAFGPGLLAGDLVCPCGIRSVI
jgi:hypothetical protein